MSEALSLTPALQNNDDDEYNNNDNDNFYSEFAIHQKKVNQSRK